MQPLDFRLSWYCSGSMRLSAMISLVAGVAIAITASIYIGAALLLVLILMITTQYRLTIDLDKGTYHDYVWCLGFKNGEKGKFDRIQYLFITKNRVNQTMASRASQSTFVRDLYNGYLKFSETEKIHLRSEVNKEILTNAMQHLAMKLKCEVVDYSIGER